VLAFESWEGLSSVLTGERYRLLRHVHEHPTASISALARSLKRQYRRVHADVAALERAGLLERVAGAFARPRIKSVQKYRCNPGAFARARCGL
jgi:predicted transcriptional regulator